LGRRRALLVLGGLLVIAGGAVVVVLALGSDDGGNAHKLKDPNPQNRGFDVAADVSKFAGPPPLQVKFRSAPFDAAGDVKYHWVFDDGTTSSEQSPTHTFNRSGYYEVVLRAKDEKGNQNGWALVLGVWPRKTWLTGRRGRTAEKTLDEVRKQTRRTEKRRKELAAKGLPVFEGTSVPIGASKRQHPAPQQ
jgi:hypothetical protein